MLINSKFETFFSAQEDKLTGLHLVNLLTKKGALFMHEKNNVLSGTFDFILNFYNPKTREHISYNLIPLGKESIAGNLFGFNCIKLPSNEKRFDQMGYNFSFVLNDLTNTVLKTILAGEDKTESIKDYERIKWWYKSEEINEVVVEKKTIHFFAIQFNSGKWLYILCGGEGYFDVQFHVSIEPEEFIKEHYAHLESDIKILEVIV